MPTAERDGENDLRGAVVFVAVAQQHGEQKRSGNGGMKRAPQVLACGAHMIDKGILSQPTWP